MTPILPFAPPREEKGGKKERERERDGRIQVDNEMPIVVQVSHVQH
jgi:hypothetical protein